MATATQTVSAPARAPQTEAETRQGRIDVAGAALAKAESAVERLRAELRSVPARVRAVLAAAADDGEAGRASAEERLLALCTRRSALPALIAVAEVVAAAAEVGLRDLEQHVAHEAYARAVAKERALAPPRDVVRPVSARERALVDQAAATCRAATYGSQAAADHCQTARQRLSAALAVTLE